MIEEKKNLIKNYITKDECNYMADDISFDCDFCSCFEECYMKSRERCNREFSKSVEYSGYNTSEDFWEQI